MVGNKINKKQNIYSVREYYMRYIFSKFSVIFIHVTLIQNYIMAFVLRENKQAQQKEQGRAFGKGLFAQQDQGLAQKKNREQLLYKQELQRQMKEKQDRKKKQQQKIRLEDEKFMRQIDQINKKQQNIKNKDKNVQQGQQMPGFNPTFETTHQHSQKGTLQININQPKPINNKPEEVQNRQIKAVRKQYIQQQPQNNYYGLVQPMHDFYEERIRKHKEALDRKLDQLFSHIHSTQDNVKVEQELQKIRLKLKGRQMLLRQGLRDDSGNYQNMVNDSHIDEYSKFYRVPKKNSYGSPQPRESRAKKLDYQSSSHYKLSSEHLIEPRNKIRTHMEQYPQTKKYSSHSKYRTKWGKKQEKDKFLSDRDALDLQIQRTDDKISQMLQRLSNGI